MAIFDLPYEQLVNYKPERVEPPDFDDFWQATLEESRGFSLNPHFEAVDFGLCTLDTYDVTFSGFGGQPVKGWLILPHQRQSPLPCVVEFIGYGGGRGFPLDWLTWASAGYANFIMDTRGQGSSWLQGDTPDSEPADSNPQYPGFMTRGVLAPQTYYYRRVFVDAIRAVEAARSYPEIDPSRIAVSGGSQGGGIAIAAAALDPSIPVCMPDVPFLCHFRRATEIVDTYPYHEIVQFCKAHRDKVDQVFTTLAYFDNVNLATRAHARAMFSTALMDQTCPPSTVFAAYNYYAGPKQIKVWPFNEHEGGKSYQSLEKIRFLNSVWGNP